MSSPPLPGRVTLTSDEISMLGSSELSAILTGDASTTSGGHLSSWVTAPEIVGATSTRVEIRAWVCGTFGPSPTDEMGYLMEVTDVRVGAVSGLFRILINLGTGTFFTLDVLRPLRV
ncbi:hypothetical protein CDL15_Pgr022335 [Punica granatum]|uniref:Uncharacterized protein n=1 Tax=Punica granatum TaxID=22663 RepID=A0A218Y3Y6_PUNGR|nr:hypothetical protein CDL15_Pgr022335 [Punica granatum]